MKASKAIKAVLISVLASVVAASLHAQSPPVPTGVFYLPSMGTIDPNALNNPNVDGVVVGGRWSDLEPNQPGVYSWTQLDTIINQVEASNHGHGKPMRLEIATGGPDAQLGPTVCSGFTPSTGSKPHWLINEITSDSYAGGKFFTYKDSATTTATIPVFWEPTLLSEHAALVQAVANHVAAHRNIQVVFVPYANANTDDWNIGDISPNPDGLCIGGSPQSRWQATITGSGYATMADALIAAGNYTYAAYHAAFPNKILTTSIGRLQNSVLNPNGGDTGRNISETVVSSANTKWPGHIAAQKQNLNGGSVLPAPGIQPDGTLTPWNDLYRLHTIYGIPTAAQMVFHAYNDIQGCQPPPPDPYYAQRMDAGSGSACMDSTQMLYQAVNTGSTYQTQWQEIYELDILNLATPNNDPHIPVGVPSDVISYAHQLLHP